MFHRDATRDKQPPPPAGIEEFVGRLANLRETDRVAARHVLVECDSLTDSVLLRKRRAACQRFLSERRAAPQERQ